MGDVDESSFAESRAYGNLWIGLEEDINGNWLWGGIYEPTYRNWAVGQPDSTGLATGCVSAGWSDTEYTDLNPYMCTIPRMFSSFTSYYSYYSLLL
jgi:hypothetical protein